MGTLDKSKEVFKDLATAGLEARYGGEGKAIAFLLFGGYGVPGLLDDAELAARGAFADDPQSIADKFTKDAAASLVKDAAQAVLIAGLQRAGVSLSGYAKACGSFFALLLDPVELGNAELPRSMRDLGLQKGIKPGLFPASPTPSPGDPSPAPSPRPPAPPSPSPSPHPPAPSSPPPSPDPFPSEPREPRGPRPTPPSPSPSPEPSPGPAPRPEPPAPEPRPKPPAPPKGDDPPAPPPRLGLGQDDGDVDVRPDLAKDPRLDELRDGNKEDT